MESISRNEKLESKWYPRDYGLGYSIGFPDGHFHRGLLLSHCLARPGLLPIVETAWVSLYKQNCLFFHRRIYMSFFYYLSNFI